MATIGHFSELVADANDLTDLSRSIQAIDSLSNALRDGFASLSAAEQGVVLRLLV